MKQAVSPNENRVRQVLLFMSIGGGVFVIGQLLLYSLTFVMNPIPANTIQLIVTVALSLELNRRLTWADRFYDKHVALRFVTTRIATLVVSWLAFIPLHMIVNYLIANTIIVATVTVFNFVIGDTYVFNHREVKNLAFQAA